MPDDLRDFARLLREATEVTVLTGAGISTDSGIPDFRGPQGLWTKDPAAERLSSFQDYVRDPELRVRAWAARAAHPAWHAIPNIGHRALSDAQHAGKPITIATQNIDGLHQAAGSDPASVLELHGNIWGVRCLSCGRRTEMSAELERVARGDPDPACTRCGGILKSATIAFGQPLDADVIGAAARAARRCHVFLAIGSTLTVHPAASLCDVAVQAGGALIVLNDAPTPYDEIATSSGGGVVRASISEALPELLGVVARAP